MLNTATKLRLARALATMLLSLGFRPHRRIARQGITYDVDIREGIDLSLFLFGSFQSHLLRCIRQYAPSNGVVIDVGANIGALTLPIAALMPAGHVYAFEPTDYAFEKLEQNLRLNPLLGSRVTVLKAFVAESPSANSKLSAYSSWPLYRSQNVDPHPIHGGLLKPATCGQTTLDVFVEDRGLRRVSMIKIDTDGHEFGVLSGGLKCLERFRPVVLFEACEYLMQPPRATYADFDRFFKNAGYTIMKIDQHRSLSADEFRKQCPVGGSLDLRAVANEQL